ncbi:MAG: shufflon system plasmid conjugative transfer pilus tip adhesin PilV [Desulfovibrio sp.]|nr:shufflon system plasmid conjugative transfer pilus tip adhesin PilV [Desulfovibrio sp.]
MNLFEAVLSLGLCLLLLKGLFPLWEQWRESSLEHKLASDMCRVVSAVQAYTQAHVTELYAEAEASSGPSWSSAEGLPEVFAPYLLHAHSGRNSLGWHYEWYLRKLPLGEATDDHALMLVVLCQAKTSLSQKMIRSAAGLLARQCQSLPVERYHELAGYLDDQGQLVSSSQRLDLQAYGIRGQEGSLGYVATLLGAEAWARAYGSDQLYRTAIAGMPQLNSMATDLDLDRHRLANVAALGLLPVSDQEPEDALAGQVFLRESEDGETLGLYYQQRQAGGLIRRKILDSSSPNLRGIFVVGHGQRLLKPECENAKAGIAVLPLGGRGSDTVESAYYEEDAVAWTIRLREKLASGLWQDAQAAKAQVLTFCVP